DAGRERRGPGAAGLDPCLGGLVDRIEHAKSFSKARLTIPDKRLKLCCEFESINGVGGVRGLRVDELKSPDACRGSKCAAFAIRSLPIRGSSYGRALPMNQYGHHCTSVVLSCHVLTQWRRTCLQRLPSPATQT